MATIENEIKRYIGDRDIAGQNEYLSTWQAWYRGYVPDFHEMKVYTATKTQIIRQRKHLPSAKFICEAWANLLLNEKTDYKMNDDDKFKLDLIFKNNNFWVKANQLVERSFALGIGALVLRVSDIVVDANGNIIESETRKKAQLHIDSVDATKIYPITIENGIITECAFAVQNTQDSYITLHLKDELGEYVIKTLHYKGKEFNVLVEEISFNTHSSVCWYSIFHPNISNNNDLDCGVGISIFSNCIDQLKAIDTKYDLFDTEFRLGRKRTYVKAKMQNYDLDGNLNDTFTGTEEDIFVIPDDENNPSTLITNDTSNLRTQQCVEALNSELSMLGYLVGFGKGYLTFNAESTGRPIQTATASMMQNNDLFRTIHKHEIIVEQSLIQIIQAIVYASNTYTSVQFSQDVMNELQIIFDDSLFEDKESERTSARTDIQNGLMSEYEYRIKFYGETEEEAKEKLANNANYVSKYINLLLPALQSGALTPKQFIKTIWFKEDSELEKKIEESLKNSSAITQDDLLNFNLGNE